MKKLLFGLVIFFVYGPILCYRILVDVFECEFYIGWGNCGQVFAVLKAYSALVYFSMLAAIPTTVILLIYGVFTWVMWSFKIRQRNLPPPNVRNKRCP
jgi:hypothetical protein